MPVAAPAQETAMEGRGVRTDDTPGELLDEADPQAFGLPKFKVWNLKGGYVSAGVAMRNLGKGNIKLKGIPVGAKVQAAYLYWNIIAHSHKAAHAKGKVNGVAITGSLIGTTKTPCWHNFEPVFPESRSYRANVTSLVKKNGTYKLRGFASGLKDGSDPWVAPVTYPLMEGASLVVVYSQSGYPYTRILLYNGAKEVGMVASARTTTMGTIPSYSSHLAYTTFIGGDGQSASELSSKFAGKAVKAADWDGTDPTIIFGNYSQGNLWDTENSSWTNTAKRGISVGRLIPAGASNVKVIVRSGSDCLVHVAQVLSVSDGSKDTDKDGLPDSWEADGYDHLSDGSIDVDLPKLGANPFHKDLFLEIDWMSTGLDDHHRPNDTVVNRMVNTFRKGNVNNPDGVQGVALHVDRSNRIPHTQDVAATSGALWTAAEALKTANMAAARYKTHHWQLWAHDLTPGLGSVSGMAQGIPADDSIVSLGSWSSEGTTDARTGTGIHELGHTINLTHGSKPGVTAGDGGIHDPYKPNHISLMSYLYQTVGLAKNGSLGYWDFQRWNLPALDESCLDETAGVGSLAALDMYGLRWYYPAGTLRQDLTAGSANGPVDWNASGVIANCAINYSINNDGDVEVLTATYKEWSRLVFDGGAVGLGMNFGMDEFGNQIPVFEIDPETYHELSYEEFLEMQLSISSEITPIEGEGQ
jgi:hypothetical protein